MFRGCSLGLLMAVLASSFVIFPSPFAKGDSAAKTSSQRALSEDDARFAGEQRFRTNCGRCHMAPHKFPPRMMATIIRHMRVRATLTDQDMRLILRYMTQ
jgi:mono/diheme cytochrome c family protein